MIYILILSQFLSFYIIYVQAPDIRIFGAFVFRCISNEEQIWDILKKIKLYNFINDKSEKLQYKIAESGSNFSQGQKQLICIGRALLKQSKLLLLDEATSSIDKYTDQLLQNLIRKEFNDKTVLCIEHRINTIRDYDRIMVLSKGNIVEFDNSNVLLKNKNGIFSSIVNDSVSNNHINNNHIIEMTTLPLNNLLSTKFNGILKHRIHNIIT